MSWTNGAPAAQSRDEFTTIEEEEDSANFTIAMCHCRAGHAQFLIRLQITIFYFPYMETNWLDCDGTWQSV